MKVFAFNIKYKSNRTYLTCCGSEALSNFINRGIANIYNSASAPTELEIDINFNKKHVDLFTADFDELYDLAHKVLEDETGLEIVSFSMKF